jgi:hypothetical protein
VRADDGAVEHLHEMRGPARRPASAWKKASKVPVRLSRQKRFQMLFQLPNSAGSARQVTLWTAK